MSVITLVAAETKILLSLMLQAKTATDFNPLVSSGAGQTADYVTLAAKLETARGTDGLPLATGRTGNVGS